MYVIVQFNEGGGEGTEGGLGVVLKKWITPRKKEVFWPPVKEQKSYEKMLRQNTDPNPDNWEIYGINRCFYETEDFEKAKQKLKKAEITSDLQSEEEGIRRPRVRNKPKRLYSTSDDDDEINFGHQSAFQCPPKLSKPSQITDIGTLQPSTLLVVDEEFNNLLTPQKSIIPEPTVPTPYSSLTLQLSPNKLNVQKTTSTRSAPYSNNKIINDGNIREDSVGLQKKILDTLITIREQNKQLSVQNNEIISLLKKNQDNIGLHISFKKPDLPVGLPLLIQNDLQELECYLSDNDDRLSQLGAYFASIGGKTLATRTYGVLKQLLSDELASFYNFYGAGKSNKKAFSKLTLNKLVLYAVKSGNPQATDAEVENCIKVWLKHARERLHKKRKLNV